MKTLIEIKKGLREMETRKKSYLLDMVVPKVSDHVALVYDTELIRKLEVTDATINTLKWVLQKTKTESRPIDFIKKKNRK